MDIRRLITLGVSMPGYSDKELPYAIPVAEGLLKAPSFLNWLIAGTRMEEAFANATPMAELQFSMRGKTKAPFWFNYWCGKDTRCECRIGTGVETDIFLVFATQADRRMALHIEDEDGLETASATVRPSPTRAVLPVGRRSLPDLMSRIPEHHDFLTILVAGPEIMADPRHRHFDKLVTHADISRFIPNYPAAP